MTFPAVFLSPDWQQEFLWPTFASVAMTYIHRRQPVIEAASTSNLPFSLTRWRLVIIIFPSAGRMKAECRAAGGFSSHAGGSSLGTSLMLLISEISLGANPRSKIMSLWKWRIFYRKFQFTQSDAFTDVHLEFFSLSISLSPFYCT